MSVLSEHDIRRLIKQEPPLIEGYINLDEQVQPNGFELTLRDIAAYKNAGQIARSNKDRVLPDLTTLPFGADGFIRLQPGAYLITYNEIVNLPKDIMALGRPRSSLYRCGVGLGMAVWDAGYHGRSQSMLVVYNPGGFRAQQNARVAQLVFMEMTGASKGYQGIYQGENI
jgi:dUTP pyrophosphatase